MKWEFCNKECYKVSEKQKKEALDYEENLIKNKSIRNGPLYKIKDDPRKTKIGNFIERYSIDEFPQFFNVLV
jgi:lipopolysaccharide/colanic/teichoic acid biosynthesis glycosyltransferase